MYFKKITRIICTKKNTTYPYVLKNTTYESPQTWRKTDTPETTKICRVCVDSVCEWFRVAEVFHSWVRLGGGSGWYLRVCPRVCPALAENHQNANPFAQNVGLLKMTRASAKNPDPRAGHSRHLTLLSIAIHAVLNQSVVTPAFPRYYLKNRTKSSSQRVSSLGALGEGSGWYLRVCPALVGNVKMWYKMNNNICFYPGGVLCSFHWWLRKSVFFPILHEWRQSRRRRRRRSKRRSRRQRRCRRQRRWRSFLDRRRRWRSSDMHECSDMHEFRTVSMKAFTFSPTPWNLWPVMSGAIRKPCFSSPTPKGENPRFQNAFTQHVLVVDVWETDVIRNCVLNVQAAGTWCREPMIS